MRALKVQQKEKNAVVQLRAEVSEAISYSEQVNSAHSQSKSTEPRIKDYMFGSFNNFLNGMNITINHSSIK
jgi:hypothetical protein